MAIPNKYKNTLDDFIDSSDAEFSDQPKPIDKRSCNVSRFESSPTRLLKGDYLYKDITDKSLWLVPKTRDFQVYQRHDIIPFYFKSERSQYKKVQRSKKDEKSQKDG